VGLPFEENSRMTTVNKYSIYCETEADTVYMWSENEPTVCPNNNGHTIDTDSISIVDHVEGNHVDINNIATTSDDYLEVVVEPREGDAINFYSPNFCDRTTWYQNATDVTEFELTDSGDLTTWNTNGTHPGPWIDMSHGKLFKEPDILAKFPGREMVVEVSTDSGSTWTPKTENSIDGADGDYEVDYDNGTVTFNSALNSGDQVRASFAKAASNMLWTVQPSAGKRLKLIYAEIQLTKDASFEADFVYGTWAYNPADLPNKIQINEFRYRSVSDLLFESNGIYPVMPACGGTGPRGMQQDVIIFPFKYNTARDMRASQGVEVRVSTANVHGGTMATTTFYCLQADE